MSSNKLVLTTVQEVPDEVVFCLSDAQQDTNIPNRYWFNYPEQWYNQSNKDPIIGIRNMFITKTNRLVYYEFKVELCDDKANVVDCITSMMRMWLDNHDNVRRVAENFYSNWLSRGVRSGQWTDEQHKWDTKEVLAYYMPDTESSRCCLYFGRGFDQSETYVYEQPGDDTDKCYTYSYRITLTPLNDDTRAVFGIDDCLQGLHHVKTPAWTRYNCLVKSSIAELDKNNILGHTRSVTITPIKYYRLHNNSKRFWIELYETSFHNIPVTLPKDMHDDLFIEAVLCFSSQGMV